MYICIYVYLRTYYRAIYGSRAEFKMSEVKYSVCVVLVPMNPLVSNGTIGTNGTHKRPQHSTERHSSAPRQNCPALDQIRKSSS